MLVLVASAGPAHTTVQWLTLVWILGAVVVAAVIIAIIVMLSRRPQSMEDGMAEFSKSLQAVAPNHRSSQRQATGPTRPGPYKAQEQRPARATRGETDPV
jgi:hypothetical protein